MLYPKDERESSLNGNDEREEARSLLAVALLMIALLIIALLIIALLMSSSTIT